MNEWQPIETAPRDGTWVLLTGGIPDFDDYSGEIASWPPCAVAFWFKPDDEGYWAMGYWDGGWLTAYKNSTHWMPLPEPPK